MPASYELHGNLIRAEIVVPSASFRLISPTSGETIAHWPRSSGDDVRRAAESATESGNWRGLREGDRRDRLAAAARAIGGEPDPTGEIGASIGLGPPEVEALFGGLERRLVELLEDATAASPAGVALVSVHWSELFDGLARSVFPLLLSGTSVCLLGDPRVPALTNRFALALAACGVGGAISTVHDDGDGALRVALTGGWFERFLGSGPASRLEAVTRIARGARPAVGAAFGAGIVELPEPTVTWRALQKRTIRVGLDGDPERVAWSIARGAIGRVEALSGQAPGQVGRVACDPRRFSALSTELLHALESDEPDFEPLPLLDPDAATELSEALNLGLDEGATLIHEGGPTGSRAQRSNARLRRLVFTNVEPDSRLAARTRPVPLLLLMRVAEGAGGA